jgi:hypothetical protein
MRTPITIAIHAMGMVMMALVEVRIRVGLETRSLSLRHAVPIVIGVVGALGLLLAVLHGARSGRSRICGSARSTRYIGDALFRRLDMMRALEAVDGMLLFGISTAYIFAVIVALAINAGVIGRGDAIA